MKKLVVPLLIATIFLSGCIGVGEHLPGVGVVYDGALGYPVEGQVAEDSVSDYIPIYAVDVWESPEADDDMLPYVVDVWECPISDDDVLFCLIEGQPLEFDFENELYAVVDGQLVRVDNIMDFIVIEWEPPEDDLPFPLVDLVEVDSHIAMPPPITVLHPAKT